MPSQVAFRKFFFSYPLIYLYSIRWIYKWWKPLRQTVICIFYLPAQGINNSIISYPHIRNWSSICRMKLYGEIHKYLICSTCNMYNTYLYIWVRFPAIIIILKPPPPPYQPQFGPCCHARPCPTELQNWTCNCDVVALIQFRVSF